VDNGPRKVVSEMLFKSNEFGNFAAIDNIFSEVKRGTIPKDPAIIYSFNNKNILADNSLLYTCL